MRQNINLSFLIAFLFKVCALTLAAVLVVSTICPQAACADTGKIAIEHVPGGTLIEVDGKSYMAYDLEGLKRLAIFDAQHGDLKRRYGLLGQRLKIKDEQIESLTETVALLENELEMRRTPVVLEPACPDTTLWSPTHLIIEGVLVAVIGGLIYALAQ